MIVREDVECDTEHFTREGLQIIYDRIKIEKEFGTSVYPKEYFSLFDSILNKIEYKRGVNDKICKN